MSGDFPVVDIAVVRQPQAAAATRLEIACRVCERLRGERPFRVTGRDVPGRPILLPSPMLSSIALAEKLAVRRPRPEQNRGYIRAGRGTSGSIARRRDAAGPEGAVHSRSVRHAGDAVLRPAGGLS